MAEDVVVNGIIGTKKYFIRSVKWMYLGCDLTIVSPTEQILSLWVKGLKGKAHSLCVKLKFIYESLCGT